MLSEHPPKSMAELEAALKESPTRFKKYGAEIYRLVGG
jgi:hypothetical protein